MPRFSASNAYYAADISTFLSTGAAELLGEITHNTGFSVEPDQRDAWEDQIAALHGALSGFEGALFLEFEVPRLGSRLDVALLSGPAIFPIEFKVGEVEYKRDHINQVWDYALDLKNFHQASHGAPIIPVLVCTRAPVSDTALMSPHPDGVFRPVRCNTGGLRQLLLSGLEITHGAPLDPEKWGNSPYEPTPTIIQAAQALYAQHSVDAITRREASGRQLKLTSARIEELVEDARIKGRKTILFVTGVPGAGKTLVGLNTATKKRDETKPTHAVFLSGNGPLVEVLREALTRDELARLRRRNNHTRKGVVKQKVKAFIQNVHHFRDAGLRDSGPPVDHVVIFDEAQRAWNKEMTASFMRRKKKRPGFTQSEPEFLISYLDRHSDWAAVVCLVGGGQEINTGEAGISAWLEAVRTSFTSWHVYISPNLTDSEYDAGHALDRLAGRSIVVADTNLHLSVSVRSFRAEKVSGFVKALLDCDKTKAREIFNRINRQYPVVLTRDLAAAKRWIREHARGGERFGMVASSAAHRLKPHAIDIRVDINPVHWFLSGPDDTRSSYYLEDAATEFQIQGLELDWVCVTWDADLRFADSTWDCRSFRGSKWTTVHKADRRQYLRNAYRVLLTRARQGMVIFVPPAMPPTQPEPLSSTTLPSITSPPPVSQYWTHDAPNPLRVADRPHGRQRRLPFLDRPPRFPLPVDPNPRPVVPAHARRPRQRGMGIRPYPVLLTCHCPTRRLGQHRDTGQGSPS
jgi:hypothetical protein